MKTFLNNVKVDALIINFTITVIRMLKIFKFTLLQLENQQIS